MVGNLNKERVAQQKEDSLECLNAVLPPTRVPTGESSGATVQGPGKPRPPAGRAPSGAEQECAAEQSVEHEKELAKYQNSVI